MVCTKITIIFAETVRLGTSTIQVFRFVKGNLQGNQKLINLSNIGL